MDLSRGCGIRLFIRIDADFEAKGAMSLKPEKYEWELPRLRESHRFPEISSDLWSVKFYPYTAPGVDPIFATVGGKQILICRLPEAGKEGRHLEVIQTVTDDELGADNFSCAWTKEISTGTPLLCVAGDIGKIIVINALTGKLHMTLAGHGGPVNDIVVSPTNPQILASASDDLTVRIWSLDPAHRKDPCAAILAGDGHREKILSISFHATGRYLLSGGIDHIINLWVLPELPDSNTGTGKVTRIHYPHFSTSEVHMRHVDCVAFYNDLILSKCDDENCIVLWAISGFSSKNQIPSPLSAPTTHDSARETRSAFTTGTVSPGTLLYTRLLEFSIPDSELMFMRFSLFPGSATANPVLAMCNASSKVFFWDLSRLEEYQHYITNLNSTERPDLTKSAINIDPTASADQDMRRPPFLIPYKHRNRGGPSVIYRAAREASPVESTSTDSMSNAHHSSTKTLPPASTPDHSLVTDMNGSHNSGRSSQIIIPGLSASDSAKSLEIWSKRYSIGDPHGDIVAHKDEVIKGFDFVGRYVAWSNGGEWCVVVGSAGVIGVFERWQK